ncbi:hypothetical protein ACFQHV_03870 [Promicromonospora thailandica]|uniref:PknH-like protein n=1 Tax=Promicromonospora thailandica TaxID=765201 RepID=A0A9X2JVJ4_9MICO|nr:hypothetical protein [Promicromonospora thailandica]MCP2265665.1 hypothetical protein [Promicromonospora thailandica]
MRARTTTRRSRYPLLAALCAAPLLLTACGTAAALLDTDALPPVQETTDGDMGAPGVGWCDALGHLETSRLSNAADGTTGEQYVLENGDVVGATVFVPGGGTYPDAASMLAAVEAAVDECSTDAEKGSYGKATAEPIDGLPDEAVGFTFTSMSSNPVEVGSIAFAEAEDGRLVGVGVTHSGSGEASVDVADLLSTALERA